MAKMKKGFAVMDPEKRRKVCSLGGKRAHELGKAHTFSHEEAVAAGKKGGTSPTATGKTRHRFTSATASAAGKKSAATRKKAD